MINCMSATVHSMGPSPDLSNGSLKVVGSGMDSACDPCCILQASSMLGFWNEKGRLLLECVNGGPV